MKVFLISLRNKPKCVVVARWKAEAMDLFMSAYGCKGWTMKSARINEINPTDKDVSRVLLCTT